MKFFKTAGLPRFLAGHSSLKGIMSGKSVLKLKHVDRGSRGGDYTYYRLKNKSTGRAYAEHLRAKKQLSKIDPYTATTKDVETMMKAFDVGAVKAKPVGQYGALRAKADVGVNMALNTTHRPLRHLANTGANIKILSSLKK